MIQRLYVLVLDPWHVIGIRGNDDRLIDTRYGINFPGLLESSVV